MKSDHITSLNLKKLTAKRSNITLLVLIAILIVGIIFTRFREKDGTQIVDVQKSAALYAEGNKLLMQKDYKGSIDKLSEALKYDPKNYNNNFNLGVAYYGDKNYTEATKYLKQSLDYAQSASSRSNTNNVLGNAYRDMGSFDQAVESYRDSILANKRNYNAYLNMANIYESKREKAKAIEIMEQGFTENKNQPEIASGLFRLLVSSGQKDRALKLYNELAPVDKSSSLIKASLGI